MYRLRLIAQREVVAYASVPSFWVAMLMGPLLMLLAAVVGNTLSHPVAPPPLPIAIEAPDAAVAASAREALRHAAELSGEAITFVDPAMNAKAATVIKVDVDASGSMAAHVSGQPLSKIATVLLQKDLAQAGLTQRLRNAGASDSVLAAADGLKVSIDEAPVARTGPAQTSDPGRFGRFSVMLLLWMTLIGALGMLLQAIVRERSNRALESLLSAARPSEIVYGKLAGVGALSVLVLAVWLGAGAVIGATPIGAGSANTVGFLLKSLKDPLVVARATLIYVMAFAMYGSAMIGLGAVARDVPSAQNLSRPIFGILLIIFFVGLAQLAGGPQGLGWLVYVPLFSPFMLLLAPPEAIGALQTAGAMLGMIATTIFFGWLATRALTDKSWKFTSRKPRGESSSPEPMPVSAA